MGVALLLPFFVAYGHFLLKRIVVIITDTLEMFLPLQTSSGLVQLPKPYFLNNSCTVNHGLQPKFTLVSHKKSLQFWIFFRSNLPQFWIFLSRPHSAELWPRQRKTTGRSAERKLRLRSGQNIQPCAGWDIKEIQKSFHQYQRSLTKILLRQTCICCFFTFCLFLLLWAGSLLSQNPFSSSLQIFCKYLASILQIFSFSVSQFPPKSKSAQPLLANICPQGACCGCDS